MGMVGLGNKNQFLKIKIEEEESILWEFGKKIEVLNML